MPLIWAAISAHGYGHAAQVVPVLNALGALVPDLHALLRTTVQTSFFQDRLMLPWEMSAVQQDVGCIQDGPLTINSDTTWRTHEQFHATWHDRLSKEVDALRAARPDIVLADAPYLALAAAKAAGIPSVAHVSLTWDLVLASLPSPPMIDRRAFLEAIRSAYRQADHALRITPCPKIDVFANPTDISPIAEPSAAARRELAAVLNLRPQEKTVLIGFGGIPFTSLPFDELNRMEGYRFLIDGPVPENNTLCVSTRDLPFTFKTLLASVDVIMTKPGYGTIVEAVALKQPVVYVRRYTFADEEALVEFLHRYGRGIELSRENFTHARWETALTQVLQQLPPHTPLPPVTGAMEAAAFLASHLGSRA